MSEFGSFVCTPRATAPAASYDGNGNFVTSTDAKSQTATYVTDPFNRPRTIGFADGSTLTFTFDDANRLTQLADTVAGTTNLAWDVYDRPTSIASPWGSVTYQFDTLGRMEWIQLPSGTRSTYGYDAANRITSLTVGTQVFSVTYDANGRPTSLTQPNGTTRTHAYNLADQLLSVTYSGSAMASTGWAYAYDSAGRLSTISGVLSEPIAPLTSQTATFDDANQITTQNGTAVTSDLNASQLTAPGLAFTYDARGRMRTAFNGSQTATYTVNPFGFRDTKVYGGTTTHYLYDTDGHLVAETDAANVTQREYIWIGDMPVMVRVWTAGTPADYFIWADHLNTPRVVTDQTNTMRWKWDSDAYGNGAPNINPSGVAGATFTFNLRFPGQYFDQETGLHYNVARYYEPKTGRYLQADPIGLVGGLNVYGYVGGNPLRWVDFMGLDRWGADPTLSTPQESPQRTLDLIIYYTANFKDPWSAAYSDRAKVPQDLNTRNAEHFFAAQEAQKANFAGLPFRCPIGHAGATANVYMWELLKLGRWYDRTQSWPTSRPTMQGLVWGLTGAITPPGSLPNMKKQ